MDVTIAGPDIREAWDAYLERSGCRYPYGLSPFLDVVEETFRHESIRLVARNGGIICGVLPAFFLRSRLFGKLFATLPFLTYGGGAADVAEAAESLLEVGAKVARERGARFWMIRQGSLVADHGHKLSRGFHLRSEKVHVLLPLPETTEALSEGFRSKLRSQIRKAEKNSLVVWEGREKKDLDAFHKIFARNMRDLGTPCYPKAFFGNILRRWNNSKILTVWKGHVPVGGAFLIGWRDWVEIPWASTDRRYNRLAPNMLLYNESLKSAIRSGYRVFDFGRSTPGEGTHQFKLQWGGEEHPLPWIYWTASGEPPVLNRRNRKFTFLSDCWKRLPLPVARILGPSIIRNIP